MLNRMLSCSLLLTALAANNAIGAPVKTVGFDDMSCRAWVKSKDDSEQRKIYLAWIRGVLTGHNYANQSQQVSSISSGTVENFVDRYCAEKTAWRILRRRATHERQVLRTQRADQQIAAADDHRPNNERDSVGYSNKMD